MIPTTRDAESPSPPPAGAAAPLGDHLDRLGTLVARGEELAAPPLAALVALLVEVGGRVGDVPPAPGADAPVVVSLRTAGVLAARTTGRTAVLDPAEAARAARLWAALEGAPVPLVGRPLPGAPSSSNGRSDLVDVA